jgi:hypothetical protein
MSSTVRPEPENPDSYSPDRTSATAAFMSCGTNIDTGTVAVRR